MYSLKDGLKETIDWFSNKENLKRYKAGIYNVTGLALYDLDKKAEAKMYFEKALALDSNFVLAKQNLQAIKAIESGTNKANPGGNHNPTSPANKQE